MSRPPVLLLLSFASCIHFPHYDTLVTAPLRPAQIVIRDVSVFSGTSLELSLHRDVVIVGGLIAEVRPTGDAANTPDLVIDGKGKTLLPGFVDLHAHVLLSAAPPWYLSLPDPEHTAQAHVYAGVTTVADLGGSAKEVLALKRKIAKGDVLGPRIYFAGPHLTVPNGYPLNMVREVFGTLASWTVEGTHSLGLPTVAAIEAEVDALWGQGARLIKLMVATLPPTGAPRLTKEMIAAAVNRAHAYGMKAAAHIDTVEDALICAELGVDLLAHGVETSKVTSADAERLVKSGIHMEPTLVGWSRWDELSSLHYQGSDLERASESADMLASLSDDNLKREMRRWTESPFRSWGEQLLAHKKDRTDNLLLLYKAGLPIHVGTDSLGTIATFPAAYHDELQKLVEAGLPAAVVLKAATGDNARFLDAGGNFGTVEKGRAADLVLVDGNPLEDIRATRKIAQVFLRGVPVKRK